MIASAAGVELDQFQSLVATRLGLQFDEGKRAFLASVFENRLDANRRMDATSYLQALAVSDWPAEWRSLAGALTVTETYFFRGPEQLLALIENVLPARIHAHASSRRLALLSAGCASGEEAYSMAILLREHYPELASWQIRIVGIDMNPAMIDRAREARYCGWSLRETPPDVRARYFREQGRDYLLDHKIRAMVAFEEDNLARAEMRALAAEGEFDVVLCRNMIMYLVPEGVRQVVGHLSRALAPGGYLFLGYAETLRGLSQDYHLCHTHDAFYYQRRREETTHVEPQNAPECQPVMPPSVEWMDSIRLAAERIGQLSRSPLEGVPGTAREQRGADNGRCTAGMGPAISSGALFANPLDLMRLGLGEKAIDADAWLLQAVVLTNCGDLPAAEALCRQVLLADELNAGAHYLAALCRERAGDLRQAIEQDRVAIYLDNTFAMPHLHLGRLEKRAGNLVSARRELQAAEILLLRENAPRILLFGDGFTREALVEFSRAEFRACGGVS